MKDKPTPLLQFKNLTIIKGDHKKILDGITVTIHEGENVVILGPNGAGKSSFIKTITREHYPILEDKQTSFKIWGQESWDVFDLRNRLGIVTANLQHIHTREISGMDIVLSGFFSSIGLWHQVVTGRMKRKVLEVLEFLEIAHLRERKMTEMSSGEARRFLIARALVHKPKALILDEPTNSLDLHALHIFRNTLRKIAMLGTSIILVTQNLQDIIPEINRVILMKRGRFVLDGPKDTVLTSKNISNLFDIPVEITKKDGYYYVFGY
jgi:iron complex transport system ATP-binding protein